jgi:hypothetical protein
MPMETAWEQGPIGFGDNVRVLAAPVTEAAGLAGLQGQVFGETTPSVTGVDVVGSAGNEYAINVHFEELDRSIWFAPDLLELVDHAPGTTITLDGVERRWTRTAAGEWIEEPLESSERKPW